jgi:hypothetical protein
VSAPDAAGYLDLVIKAYPTGERTHNIHYVTPLRHLSIVLTLDEMGFPLGVSKAASSWILLTGHTHYSVGTQHHDCTPESVDCRLLLCHYSHCAGKMSKHLGDLKVGESVAFKGPIPKYPYTANTKKEIGMVAGGKAPLLSVPHGRDGLMSACFNTEVAC